jgi:hypothetical protein
MTDPANPKPTTFDVFISYSNVDTAIAEKVCAALEAAKVKCWIAPRDILPGLTWSAAIVEAIKHSRAMLLIFSDGANKSQQVQREVDGAVSKNMPVLPMRVENVPPTGSMEYFLKAVHWLDAFTPPIDDHLPRLTEAVKALLSTLPREPPAKAAPDKPKPAAQPDAKSAPGGAPSASASPGSGALPTAQAGGAAAAQVATDIAARREQRDRPFLQRFKVPIAASLAVIALVIVVAIVMVSRKPSVQPPVQPTETEWTLFAPGTYIVNPSQTDPVATYTDADRASPRGIDIRPRQRVPPPGTSQPLAHRMTHGEDWIRFPVGDKSGYVPQASVEVRRPSP